MSALVRTAALALTAARRFTFGRLEAHQAALLSDPLSRRGKAKSWPVTTDMTDFHRRHVNPV
jgi:hypothetical protein